MSQGFTLGGIRECHGDEGLGFLGMMWHRKRGYARHCIGLG